MSEDAEQKPLPDLRSSEGQVTLIDSINESTKHVNTFTLSFFVTCIYVAIAVAAISHETLLFGRDVYLPVLNVKVGLVSFFFLAPLLVAVLHLHLLLQEYFLSCKVRLLTEISITDGVAARFFPGLLVNSSVGGEYGPHVQLLLRFLRFIMYQALPLWLLCLIQVQFLPYHAWSLTLWHQALVVLDIALISYTQNLSLLREACPVKRQWIRSLRVLARRAVLISVAAFSLFFAVVPGTWMELLLPEPIPYADRLLDRNLSLREKTLISEHPAPELLAARRVTRDKRDALDLELGRGLDLVERDLRFADFSDSKLFNADLRGADLRGAILVHADLRGAKLMPTPKTDKPVQLTGAYLDRADLRGVELVNGHLEAASLVGAHLTASNLSGAVLIGADLRGARLEGANLENAILDGANFAEAHLEAAEFKHATSTGAVFRNAWLQGSTALALENAILREAKMLVTNFCEESSAKSPELTDLRGVDFVIPADWEYIETRMPDSDIAKLALLRLQAARERKLTCLAPSPPRHPGLKVPAAQRRLLYSEGPLGEPMAKWLPLADQGIIPGGSWGETEFSADLAATLWERACTDPFMSQALAKRTLGDYLPADEVLSLHLACQFKRLQEKPESMRTCSGFNEIEESQRERIVEMCFEPLWVPVPISMHARELREPVA